MDEESLLEEWKRHRAAIQVPEGFAARVMGAIDHDYRLPAPGPLARLMDELDILPSRFLRVAAALGFVLLGLFRVSHVAVTLLVP